LRIGIIGCGQMGEWHWDAYRKNEHTSCVAFSDTDRSKAERFIQKTPGQIYSDYREMIKKEKLDGVSICTLPSTHHPIVMDLLDAGIHVLCEKPLAMTLKEAQAMTQKAQDKKLRLFTAFKFRFFDEVQEARKILQSGSLGKVLNFRVMVGAQADMSNTWFVKKELSGGGVVIDNGPHAFDLIRCLLGEFDKVSTQVGHYQNLPVEDTAQIVCRLKNGAAGTINISWQLPTPSKTYCEIYAEEGTLLLDFSGLTYKFKTWDDWKTIPNAASSKEAFNRQIDHFANAILGNPILVTNNEDGLKAQELIDQAYQSI
ncbi:MAG: Gfo/Idh/MocA family oxidoreductase, partial [Candidatus Omnitrophica bacterium]|nr:Gfo/Idh/MocA family oxidoreductase [Candidatus Omnitrophota bacterium]